MTAPAEAGRRERPSHRHRAITVLRDRRDLRDDPLSPSVNAQALIPEEGVLREAIAASRTEDAHAGPAIIGDHVSKHGISRGRAFRGEGRLFLGSTRADNRGDFSLTLSGRSRGEPITCTATDFRELRST